MILNKSLIKIVRGDLTLIEVEAVVNAANKSLLGGGGVDGAIHFAAGRELLEECLLLGGCEVGKAKITKGYNLPAKFIIHTVGPVYGYEAGHEAELLAACYLNSLLIARDNSIRTIAFPCISTGAFRFPKDEAAKIAIKAAKDFYRDYPGAIDEIVFVVNDELNLKIYLDNLNN